MMQDQLGNKTKTYWNHVLYKCKSWVVQYKQIIEFICLTNRFFLDLCKCLNFCKFMISRKKEISLELQWYLMFQLFKCLSIIFLNIKRRYTCSFISYQKDLFFFLDTVKYDHNQSNKYYKQQSSDWSVNNNTNITA